jgi:hypothetical protein
MITNWRRWQSYTDGLASPQNYIDWGFVYLITASLQRRVWLPPAHSKLFPNIYPILVGPPGVGKGMLIRRVSELLRHHKIEFQEFNKPKNEQEAILIARLKETMKTEEKENQQGDLIPLLPDAITYEALVKNMASAIGRVNYHVTDKDGKEQMKIATYSALAACLEELESLIRKNKSDSLMTFLIQAYDCGDEYKYETKGQGKDRILNICLNFLAGTNPDFIKEMFDEKIVSSGFSSRVHFIYATKNRKSVCFLPELTAAQEDDKLHLLKHIQDLTKLFGQMVFGPGVQDYLVDWWARFEKTPDMCGSKSPRLAGYRSRRNIHTMKLAMAFHYMERLDNVLTLDDVIKADAFLFAEEKTMHLALMTEGDTPEAKGSRKIKQYLHFNGEKTFNQLLAALYNEGITKDMMTDILSTLEKIGEVKAEMRDEAGQKFTYYTTIKKD